MLFNYPSFISTSEQSESDLLYNNIKIVLQTNLKEIWYNTDFGTNIRDNIKNGIDALVITNIQIQIEDNLLKYFKNDIQLKYLDLIQEGNKIKVYLTYIELRTGKFNTIQTEETFVNKDISLY